MVEENQTNSEQDLSKQFAIFKEAFTKLNEEVESLKSEVESDKISIIVFSGDLDKAMASMIIATGAAAMDMEVVMWLKSLVIF